ncbi:MAG: D-alanyl-D-alanine carboxypeptidase family protein [Candidatus Spechtbacterales bacterium]
MNSAITPSKYSAITESDKVAVEGLIKKIEKLKKEKRNKMVLINYTDINQILDPTEKNFVQKILAINPKKFDIYLTPVRNCEFKAKMVPIDNQIYTWQEKRVKIRRQYLPEPAYRAFANLVKSMEKDISKRILVNSGYRSPAYQLLTFIYWFSKNDYNLAQTLKSVALPGYSEHGCPKKQGVDFITENGISWGEEISFDATEEYKWLLRNGKKFNFYLSYPRNNSAGIMFEPWHWHYESR